jgi:glycine betaine/proline transport system permease protein
LLGKQRDQFLHDYKFNLEPATDDRPFHFHFVKWSSQAELIRLRHRGGGALLETGYLTLVITLVLALLFILNQGYWKETTETLTLVVTACLVCMGVGVPVGIWAAHKPRAYAMLRPVLDLMQTLPTFVYLIPAIVFFGIGMVPGLIATAIFVVPAPIRLTHLGISSTPKPLIEAAEAFGATPRQVLYKVEFPYAMPQIMAGLTQTIMLSLSMVVIAALVGADGLGVPVVRALNTVNTALGFESGFVIVVLAILLDRVFRREDV